jgi:hypothetical protein
VAVREGELDLAALEQWLWDAACVIRGPLDAPKFKDYILPLVFLKRLSDVFEEEVAHLAEEFGDLATTEKLVESDHKLVRFYVPPLARWESLSRKTTGVGQELTDAVRAITRENPRLHEPHGRAGFDEVQRDVDPGEFSSGFTRSLQVVSSTDRRHRAPAVGRFRIHMGESIASAAHPGVSVVASRP